MKFETFVFAALAGIAAAVALLALSVTRLWRLTAVARKEHAIIHNLMTSKVTLDVQEAEKRAFGP